MVKGIDPQHLVTQTYVAEKVQQVHQRHGELQQQYFDVQLAEERKRMQARIKQAEESERMKLKERRQDQEKGKDGKKEQEGDSFPEEGHMIDLKA
jgi:hypothetical protein